MNDTASFTVTVEKNYRFPAEQVFDAWLDPAMVAHWFAPQLGEMVRVDIDAREGGGFHFDQQRGDEIARHWGRYHTIERPHRLVFGWCAGDEAEAEAETDDGSSLVTIDFTPTSTGCSVTLKHEMDPQWSEYEEQVRWGWTTMLNGIHNGFNHEETPGARTAINTIRFERRLPASPEIVWAWLTESGKRALWLGGGELPAREGESFTLHFDHNSLTPDNEPVPERFRGMEDGASTSHYLLQFNPPQRLQFSWGEGEDESPSEVNFELVPDGDGTLLTIIHTLLGRDVIANVAGGWHSHLAILADRLAGVEPRPFWGLFVPVEEVYKERFFAE
ncbi:MAG: SRPBCC domain-containing protein [Pseudohongiellaceae bacterium]